jgi:diguanylate cyclase (GGDEF)-like protein
MALTGMDRLAVAAPEPAPAVLRAASAPRASRVVRTGMVVALATLLLAGVATWQLHRNATAEVKRELQQIAVLLAEQTARAFQAVDLVAKAVVEEVERSGVADAQALRQAFETHEMQQAMARRAVNLPQLEAMGLVDADGAAVITTRVWPTPPISIADRTYFRAMIDSDGMRAFISEPVLNRVSGGSTVYLSRRIGAPDGALLGVVTAAIRIAYFSEVFEAAGFGEGTGATLAREDGRILKRYPVEPAGPEERITSPAWYDLRAAGGGAYRSLGVTDGRGPRFVHARAVAPFGLFVSASRLESAALAAWRAQAAGIAGAAALALLYIGYLVRALSRHFAALEESHLALARHAAALTLSEARLADQSQVLQTTLQHMNQGLLMVDAEGRIGVWNKRAAALLDLPESAFDDPAGFAGLRALQRERGEEQTLPPAQRAEMDAGWMPEHPHVYERRTAKGTVIEVRSMPLRAGGMVRTYTDITARAEAEGMLAIAASHDPLTGLANRSGFGQRLDLALAAVRRGGAGFALLCLDLDGFKAVNDTHGHAVGDILLERVAVRMREALRGNDLLARMGGDEFAILLPEADSAVAQQVAQRMLSMVRLPYLIEGHSVCVGVSIGIATCPLDGNTAEALLRNADAALYQAKRDGRNCFRQHVGDAVQPERERRAMEAALRLAVEEQDFQLAYQPICNTMTGQTVAFEALLRWQHGERGAVAPAEFIPLAEQTGLIIPLGRWALAAACAEAAAWPVPARIAVNLSPQQFCAGDLLASVEQVLGESGLDPRRLELEITEGMVLEHSEAVIGTMRALRGMGIRLVLDDFGTANANLSYLRGFPFDAVKIDRSFLRALNTDRQARALVEAMLAMARALGLEVVGEGVETPEQLAMLRHLRCDLIQGYLLGRPEDAAAARERLARRAAEAELEAVGAASRRVRRAARVMR